ncbi:Domain of unknown function DUF1902 [Gloeothece citriformis PCC 7424]|uniref:DUF1902 domain-containing protein n=1 Tax=Gloeothece citriformis (strain PCC 7424) TaxID=65393 RepID=B7KFS4_GLOC7|nr:DUF1902 domain-containing protein [Gloeothece citriformis]ACK73399.1 Domain of unknown function DUF1902 [Gloeothece citriformis PCC 7424]
MIKSYSIEAFWDAESGVWVATSEDVPGLATEAETLDTLNNKLRQMIPELLILNGIVAEDYTGSIAIELTTHRQEIIEIVS